MKRVRSLVLSVAVVAGTLVATTAVGTAEPPAPLTPSSSPLSSATQFNGRVAALLTIGDTVFVGGSFTAARASNGSWVSRGGLAAVNGATGALIDAWQPKVNGDVIALATQGDQLFVGGKFTTVAGVARKNLAAVSLTTGQATAWSPPGPGKAVYALAVLGSRVFAGGQFTTVGSAARSRLAAFDATTGALDPGWLPAASGNVNVITTSYTQDQLYVGGTFPSINGDATFGYVAGLDPVTGSNTGWPTDHVDYPVNAFSVSADGVFGGADGAGGHLVAWRSDGTFLTTPFQTDGGVQALVGVEPGRVFAGGHFTNVCLGNTGSGSPFICATPLLRRKMFGVDLDALDYTTWNPAANSPKGVKAMALVPSTGMLFVGGDFTTINGSSRQRLAVFPPLP